MRFDWSERACDSRTSFPISAHFFFSLSLLRREIEKKAEEKRRLESAEPTELDLVNTSGRNPTHGVVSLFPSLPSHLA